MTNEERSGILGAVQPPPKLLIERLTDGDVTCLRLAGTIDEQFDAPGLALTITSKYILLDLGGVDRISSFGIRQWVDFIAAIGPRLAGIYYVECSPKVVDQFNMVANFGGPGYIVSFYAPYRCDTCEQERRLLFRTDEETPLWRAGQAPPSTCPTCNNPEDFDEEPATYFHHVAQQPMAQLPREIMTFLRVHLSYGQGGQRKLKIEKRIEGRCTYLKLSGDLDSDLKAQKLADGLEGEVVIDLGGILSLDPVGSAQWRKLMGLLEAKTGGDEQVERVNLMSVPAPFLERLGKPEDLTSKGQVLSLLIPYNCARCRATTQRLVDLAQHGDELRQGKVPRIKCGLCGGPVTCVVSETWFGRLQTLPQTVVSEELKKTLARLAAAPAPSVPQAGGRATMGPTSGLAAIPVAGQAAPSTPGWTQQPVASSGTGPSLPQNPRMTLNPLSGTGVNPALTRTGGGGELSRMTAAASASGSGSLSQPAPATGLLGKLQSIPGLLPGLLVVMLSLSGAIVYRILASPGGRGGAAEWKVVEASQAKAPAWHDLRVVSKDHTFVGHSPLLPDKADALERAEVAAHAALLMSLGESMAAKFPEWRGIVLPLYSTTLQAMQDDLSRAQKEAKTLPDAASVEAKVGPAREKLAEAYKKVSDVLVKTAAEAMPTGGQQYWEKRTRSSKGTREVAYQASSQLSVDDAAFDKLITLYGQAEGAAKVRAVSYFPMLGVRHDVSISGAIVVEVDPQSPLAGTGLQPGDIVLALSGTEVHSAKELASLLPKSVEESQGREVIIKVKRGDEEVDLHLVGKKPGGKKTGGGKKGGK